MNINSQFIHASLVGNVLAQKSGVVATDAQVIQYRINGSNPAPITPPQNLSGNGAGWGTFVMLKPVDGDLLGDLFPQDPAGDVYRASSGSHQVDLYYYGDNLNSYLSRGVYKTSNRSENEWSDFLSLTYAFSQIPAGDSQGYIQAISTNINVKEWMTYFGVCTLMNFGETALCNGIGDDFALYSGEKDRRFVVLGHDFDTIFGQGDTRDTYYPINTNSSIFIMLNPPNANGTPAVLQSSLRRFMTSFAPVFYGELKRLCDTTFNPTHLNPLLDQLLAGWGVGPSTQVISDMKTYAANRRTVALSQIPLSLTVSHNLTVQNGYPSTTTPNVTLYGAANAIDTRSVLVNGSAAAWSPLDARWTNTVTLQPGINNVLVQSFNSNDVEFARSTLDIWYNDSSVQTVSGTIASDTAWTAAGGPYQVTANLTVASGATLTIQPGTTVYLNSGVNILVANGGRLLAEGTDTASIRFTRAPGSTGNWGNIIVNGGVDSPETRVAYARFEFNANSTSTPCLQVSAGTVYFDHLTFGNTAAPYIHVDGASFVISDCVFPTATAYFELVHGTGGVKAGGHGLFLRNFFGLAQSTSGNYNDVVDFTGGNRPNQPIVQFTDNVFIGATDDHLDLDGTDAWIEGNILLHAHKNGSPDSSSAISGGLDGNNRSEITIIGNIIYDCDQAANAKEGNFYTFYNNTIVHITKQGGTDTASSVGLLADVNTAEGAGMYFEGNIIDDAEQLVHGQTNAVVTFTNNLIARLQGAPWTGPGGNNPTNDPLFAYVPAISETSNFTSWAEAQVVREWFSLRPGSPAVGMGPNGRDLGGVVPFGASVSGEPIGATAQTTATLHVGINRTGHGIPTGGFPDGSGFTHYRWRLDSGVWSAETPISSPITLSALADGPHYVDVIGRNDASLYQNDPVLGSDAIVTKSRTWTVDSMASPIRLNEILASNSGVFRHEGTSPDAIELVNVSSESVSLDGMGLTDDPTDPYQFIFPPGTMLAAGEYLVMFANNPDGTSGFHLGFNLNQSSDAVYLYDSTENSGILLDSVVFGLQLSDFSIGRGADGSWALNVPTLGAANQAAPVGDPSRLFINEWLAIGQAPFANDFIELYNADPLPVELGGLYLSDSILTWPTRHEIAALSFMPGYGFQRFFADGDPKQGADHLSFKLSSDQGAIGLYQPDLTPIDLVMYQPQRLDVSQGRSPNGSSAIVFFDQPTPGAPNPLVSGSGPTGGGLAINEVLANNASFTESDGRTSDWVELYNGSTTNIDLTDLSLTDDTQQPRRFIFPTGTQLAPGEFLRVVCDPKGGETVAVLNTNFALNATSGGVYLFDAPERGGSLLNAVIYGLQVTDLSIGRVPDGSTNWVLASPTPAAANVAVPTLGNASKLMINEWMAAPASGDDWFEIYNPNTQPVALGGLYLTDDLNDRTKDRIEALSFIGAGTNAWQRFAADGNTGAGADHVNFSLRAAGEAIGISSTSGALLDGVEFGTQDTDISEGRFPDGSSNIVRFPNTASPGESNWRLLTNVVINEVLTHTPTNTPLEDAIELRNLTDEDIDISGWWLSDDNGTLEKYQIPFPTILRAQGYVVIYESQFTNRVLAATPFALSSKGDETVLSASAEGQLTGWRTHIKFGAADAGVSFGRYITSDQREEFVAMSAHTFGVDDPSTVEEFRQGTGAPNAYPRVGPIVISEIMYHPPDLGTNDNARDEFIELHNITTAPVPLYDPDHPTNVWHLRDAVDFDFPPSTILAPGDYLLVVSFDPTNNPGALASFRNAYHVDPSVTIVGPYGGKLANSSDEIELRKPGTPDTNDVPYILVEHVRYSDSAPWPVLADGTGLSLQRLADTEFGNDPANWTASSPTPGPQAAPLDYDHDGMLDSWEIAHGLDPYNPADANLDSDGDGLTNLQEFRAGTDPRDPRSVFRIESVSLATDGTNVLLSFMAQADLSYTVEVTESLESGAWVGFQNFAAAPTNRLIQMAVPANTGARFFRLRTPSGTPEPGSLRIDTIQLNTAGNNITFSFQAAAGTSYTVEFTPDLAVVPWSAVTNYPGTSSSQVIQVPVSSAGGHGFYRLRSP